MVYDSIFSTKAQVLAPYQLDRTDLADILDLADDCLERHNDAWARFVATGDHEAFLQAMNAKQDRADLLAQLGEVGDECRSQPMSPKNNPPQAADRWQAKAINEAGAGVAV